MSQSSSPNDHPRLLRIYLCAAASDMHAERELLDGYVLPELNDRCGELGVRVEWVDVRRDAALASASTGELAAAALREIDQCRPWFIAILGDACDARLDDLPADLLAQYPWLEEHAGGSLLELELAHGVLRGDGDMRAMVYLRDDRFLRDLSGEKKATYSSEDIEDIERLETLKAKVRSSAAKLLEGYPCRWDADTDGLTDLDELGKQMIEDLYEAITQVVEPGMELSVFEEPSARGSSSAMIGSASETAASPSGEDDGDDEFDLAMEEVLDIDDPQLDTSSTSASAIEGVEPLDFLDDDSPAQPPPAVPARLEPTFEMSEIADDFDGTDTEVSDDDIAGGEAELAEADGIEAPVAEDAWSFDDDIAPVDGDDNIAAPAGITSSEPTVRDADTPTAFVSPKAQDEDDEAAFAIDAGDASGSKSVSSSGPTPTVQSASLASKPPRKTSSTAVIGISVLVLLLLAGGGVAGMYFAGMLPGAGETKPPKSANNQLPLGEENGLTRAKRINDHTQALTTLVQAAGASGNINGGKLAEAQAYLQMLQTDEPEMLAEEPIQELQKRIGELAGQHSQQQDQVAERQRRQEFLEAHDVAKSLLDRGLLEEARQLAKTQQEKSLLDEVEAAIVKKEEATAASTAAQAEQKKAAALATIVTALGDAEAYRLALDAYAKAYPEDPRSADFQKVAEVEATKMDVASDWNKMLNAWANEDMSNLSPQAAAEKAAAAEAGLKLAENLPGATEMQSRLAALKAIAARETGEKKLVDALAKTFDSPAVKTSLVFATTDGQRYYLAEKPTRDGDNYIVRYVADLEGNTKDVKIAAGDIDRDQTGRVELAAMAKRVTNEIGKIDEVGWETAFLEAMGAAQSPTRMDESTKPLDEVIRTQWLLALMDVGSRGSRPLASAIADEKKKLAASGLTPTFNWADPAAAAEKRAECVDAINELGSLDGLTPYVEDLKKSLQTLSVQGRIKPVGLLLIDSEADGGWKIEMAADAPEASGVFQPRLVLLGPLDDDPPLEYSMVGWIREGKASVDPPVGDVMYEQGRVFYAVVKVGDDDGAETDATNSGEPDTSDGGEVEE